MDPSLIFKRAWSMGKRCFLPVLHPIKKQSLWFVEYTPEDTLIKNRFKILEPCLRNKKPIPAWALDLVFTPVVAFDKELHRLGMGHGYYDNTFAFLKDKKGEVRKVPALVGLAYEFQRVKTLPLDAWDIPLTGIATEKGIIEQPY